MKLTLAPVGLLAVAMVVSAANGPADGPRVCIEYLASGWKFPIHVHLDGSVREVKLTLQKTSASHIPPEQQELLFNGQLLDDQQTLAHYNITKHSNISLIYRDQDEVSNKMFQVVRAPMRTTMGGHVGLRRWRDSKPATIELNTPGTIDFTINVDLTDTIEVVKERIHKQEEYPVEEQRLIHLGIELDNSKTLESYGIATGGLLKLDVPLKWCHN